MRGALEPGLRACLETVARARRRSRVVPTREASADDVADVAKALNIPAGGAVRVQLRHAPRGQRGPAPSRVSSIAVVFAGFEGPDDNEKYPAVYDRQVAKISALAAAQPDVAAVMPDFAAALKSVLSRAEREPVPRITVQAGGSGRLLASRERGPSLSPSPRYRRYERSAGVPEDDLAALAQRDRAAGPSTRNAAISSSGPACRVMSIAMDCASGACGPTARRGRRAGSLVDLRRA